MLWIYDFNMISLYGITPNTNVLCCDCPIPQGVSGRSCSVRGPGLHGAGRAQRLRHRLPSPLKQLKLWIIRTGTNMGILALVSWWILSLVHIQIQLRGHGLLELVSWWILYLAQPLDSKLNFNIHQLKYSLRNRFKYSNVSSGSYDPHRPGAAIETGHVGIVNNYNCNYNYYVIIIIVIIM